MLQKDESFAKTSNFRFYQVFTIIWWERLCAINDGVVLHPENVTIPGVAAATAAW